MIELNEPIDWPRLVKDIRIRFGATQVELAHHVGVTPTTVSRWETGISDLPHKIHRKKLKELAKKAGLEV